MSPSPMEAIVSASEPMQSAFWDVPMPGHAGVLGQRTTAGSSARDNDAGLEAAASWLSEDGLMQDIQRGGMQSICERPQFMPSASCRT